MDGFPSGAIVLELEGAVRDEKMTFNREGHEVHKGLILKYTDASHTDFKISRIF